MITQEKTIIVTCEACGINFDSFVLDGTPLSAYRPRFCDPCVNFMRDQYLRSFEPAASNPIPEMLRDYDPGKLKPKAFHKLRQPAPPRLLLIGGTGAGKSYLSVGLAQCDPETSKRARWATGAQIKGILKPTENAEQRERNAMFLRMVKKTRMLTIDDLGHGNWTTPYAELVLEIINARHNLRTIITTQFPPSEWRRHITGDCSGLTIDAITRRLEDYYAIWAI